MLRRLLRRLLIPASGAGAEAQLRLVNGQGQPNINDLWRATKDIEALRLSVKALGYELARTLEQRLQSIPVDPPRAIGLDSKPATQADIEARWCRGWCAALHERPRYHRRLWESAFVLQALFEGGGQEPGASVLALGPADAAILSLLAAKGVRSTVAGAGLPTARENLVAQSVFNDAVKLHPGGVSLDGLAGFDACWSIGRVGSVGSIKDGLALVQAAMATLKPGGLAVHVLDYNFADDDQTIDNWQQVLFQRRHIEALAQALSAAGHAPARLDFYLGHQPMDRFVDVPPFDTDRNDAFDRLWRDGWQGAHLKVAVDGFAATSFGLICRKGAG
jgi:hypothetical protein